MCLQKEEKSSNQSILLENFPLLWKLEGPKQLAVFRMLGEVRSVKAEQRKIKRMFEVEVKGKETKTFQGFLHRILRTVNTQLEREKAIKRIKQLIETAHKHAMDENLSAAERQKWIRLEAYMHQVLNSILREYDEAKIKEEIKKLRKMVEEQLKQASSGGPSFYQ